MNNMSKNRALGILWSFSACVAALPSASAHAANYRFGAGPDRVVSDEPHGYTQHITPDFDVQDGIAVTYVRLGGARVARLVSTSYAVKVYTDVAPLDGVDGKISAGDAWISQQVSTGALSLSVTPTAVERLLLSAARRILYESVPTTVYLAQDHLGSTTVETDADGAVIGRRSYTPFGAAAASTGDADRYGFTGQEQDDSGLVHFKFRGLDPLLGRWSSPDPAFSASTDNKVGKLGESTTAYAYVANNPIGFVDPTGLGKNEKAFKASMEAKAAKIYEGKITDRIRERKIEPFMKFATLEAKQGRLVCPECFVRDTTESHEKTQKHWIEDHVGCDSLMCEAGHQYGRKGMHGDRIFEPFSQFLKGAKDIRTITSLRKQLEQNKVMDGFEQFGLDLFSDDGTKLKVNFRLLDELGGGFQGLKDKVNALFPNREDHETWNGEDPSSDEKAVVQPASKN
jgi:RHS repeat-associated protein